MKPSWQISRRTLLRNGSVAIALPFLEQMMPARARAAESGPKRYVVMFKPNGCHLRQMMPTMTGTGVTLPPTLASLMPVRDQVVMVSGLQNKVALPQQNLHLAGIASLLTSVRPTRERAGISVDQVIAGAWRGKTALPSLELGSNMSSGEFKNSASLICEELPCSSAWSMSYADDKTMKPTEVNPQAAFDRLFVGGAAPSMSPTTSAPDAAKLRAYRQSVLDHVRGQAERLKGKLGTGDRRRMDGYLTSVRELEQRLAVVPAVSTASCRAGRPSVAGNGGYPERLKAMVDVMALALQCDATRVITHMMAEAESEYTFPGVPGASGDGHHSTSHHGNNTARLNQVAAIDRFYVEHVAALAMKLKAMPEGGGTVLDNTIIFHISDVSDGDSHSYEEMPVVLIGGGGGVLPTGRHVRFPGRPLADLHLTLLQGLGISRPTFGNSTGPLTLTG